MDRKTDIYELQVKHRLFVARVVNKALLTRACEKTSNNYVRYIVASLSA